MKRNAYFDQISSDFAALAGYGSIWQAGFTTLKILFNITLTAALHRPLPVLKETSVTATTKALEILH